MNTPEDEVPERLQGELHGLVPGLPGEMAERERVFLEMARGDVVRGGRRFGWWRGAGVAAAMVLVGVGVWVVGREMAPRPAAVASRVTIVDVLKAAKRGGVSQGEIDRMAMAAVRLDGGEVR